MRLGPRRSSMRAAGAIAGPMIDFGLRQLIHKDLQLTGATITPAGLFVRAVRLLGTGALEPILAAMVLLRELATARSALMAKKHTGGIVVTIG